MRRVKVVTRGFPISPTVNDTTRHTSDDLYRELALDAYQDTVGDLAHVNVAYGATGQFHLDAACTIAAARAGRPGPRHATVTLRDVLNRYAIGRPDLMCSSCTSGHRAIERLRDALPDRGDTAILRAAAAYTAELEQIVNTTRSGAKLRGVVNNVNQYMKALERSRVCGLLPVTPQLAATMTSGPVEARRKAAAKLADRADEEPRRIGLIARKHAGLSENAAVSTDTVLIAAPRNVLNSNVDVRAAVTCFSIGDDTETVMLRVPMYIGTWLIHLARRRYNNNVGLSMAYAEGVDEDTCRLAARLYSIDCDSDLNTATAALDAARAIAN